MALRAAALLGLVAAGATVGEAFCPGTSSPNILAVGTYATGCFLLCPEVCEPLAAAMSTENRTTSRAHVCGAQEALACMYKGDNFGECQRVMKTLSFPGQQFKIKLPTSQAGLAKVCSEPDFTTTITETATVTETATITTTSTTSTTSSTALLPKKDLRGGASSSSDPVSAATGLAGSSMLLPLAAILLSMIA